MGWRGTCTVRHTLHVPDARQGRRPKLLRIQEPVTPPTFSPHPRSIRYLRARPGPGPGRRRQGVPGGPRSRGSRGAALHARARPCARSPAQPSPRPSAPCPGRPAQARPRRAGRRPRRPGPAAAQGGARGDGEGVLLPVSAWAGPCPGRTTGAPTGPRDARLGPARATSGHRARARAGGAGGQRDSSRRTHGALLVRPAAPLFPRLSPRARPRRRALGPGPAGNPAGAGVPRGAGRVCTPTCP